jgi:ribosomal protein L32
MAVPKKRQSKSRKNTRKTTWKQKAKTQATRVISLAETFLKKLLETKS